jgi:hypothetical protein
MASINSAPLAIKPMFSTVLVFAACVSVATAEQIDSDAIYGIPKTAIFVVLGIALVLFLFQMLSSPNVDLSPFRSVPIALCTTRRIEWLAWCTLFYTL